MRCMLLKLLIQLEEKKKKKINLSVCVHVFSTAPLYGVYSTVQLQEFPGSSKTKQNFREKLIKRAQRRIHAAWKEDLHHTEMYGVWERFKSSVQDVASGFKAIKRRNSEDFR